jgi:cytochrome c oxidase subunit 2
MTPTHRPRRALAPPLPPRLSLLALLSLLSLAACAVRDYPNSTFNHYTDFTREIDHLFDTLFWWGTIVFVLVEVALIIVLVRYRYREGAPEPRHVHGHTTLEIVWTLIPAVILVLIAVPTVRTIFRTEAKAVPNALQVDVIGHQWWWEFRYPQYTRRDATGRVDTLKTANELYLPQGRTVNFALRTADVLHSFWIPQLAGKRDVISNHTNYLWFTADSARTNAWNGFCAEYCGASHANMRFRTFTVAPADFESWAAHQLTPAAFGAAAPTPAPGTTAVPGGTAGQSFPGGTPTPTPQAAPNVTAPNAAARGGRGAAPQGAPGAPVMNAALAGGAAGGSGFIAFPPERLPAYAVPHTPPPADVTFPNGLVGDPARGQKVYSSSACIGCHAIAGNPMSVGVIGPNLTHIGTRTTIAAGLYPNDARHLALWIKNARALKPGVTMPTLGKDQVDPITGQRVTAGGLDDQQIADIVAYLQALK